MSFFSLSKNVIVIRGNRSPSNHFPYSFGESLWLFNAYHKNLLVKQNKSPFASTVFLSKYTITQNESFSSFSKKFVIVSVLSSANAFRSNRLLFFFCWEIYFSFYFISHNCFGIFFFVSHKTICGYQLHHIKEKK